MELGGKNFDCDLIPGKTPSAEPGAWRIQISLREEGRENRFLNVMQVTDQGVDQVHKVEKIETDQFVGVIIGKHVVLFQKESSRVASAATFRLPQSEGYRVFISDLAPGKWKVTHANEAPLEMSVAMEAGSLYFTSKGGEDHLQR